MINLKSNNIKIILKSVLIMMILTLLGLCIYFFFQNPAMKAPADNRLNIIFERDKTDIDNLEVQIQYDISKIPQKYLDIIGGWNIEVKDNVAYSYDSKDEKIKEFKERYRGNLETTAWTISAERKIELCADCVSFSLYHELGHAVDARLGFITEKKEFIKIFEDESQQVLQSWGNSDNRSEDNEPYTIINEYCILTPSEYFASVFSLYLTDNTLLKEVAPKSYKLIDNLEPTLFMKCSDYLYSVYFELMRSTKI